MKIRLALRDVFVKASALLNGAGVLVLYVRSVFLLLHGTVLARSQTGFLLEKFKEAGNICIADFHYNVVWTQIRVA